MAITSSREESHAGAEHFCRTVRSTESLLHPESVFVAGCGRGHEALYIRKELDVKVTGVDVAQHWDPIDSWAAGVDDFELQVGSVLDLPFADSSFDIVFYHHVIEHVSDPAASLRELARVLRPNGFIYIGTPNRHRAVGYLGSFDANLVQKMQWNLNDYKARVKGKFRNELGAHAGFSERELLALVERHFDGISVLTGDYLQFKYGGRIPKVLLAAICSNALRGVAAPSVYVSARRS
ncbi:class I SAM-dependent methyltransferase [Mycolicibacterium hippocampi]|uniref:Methyltransferase type 11 domain-containing protein n=1 Tax=Mycolicibacterium hippocampi TaxID=659824 RepID=A0A850PXM4_9MYCO|nr:class I SAM-dependent methyltransferase [Mycolicibacterium hippocampi]NVN52770.1 hypothetical protein [Mycolicibacterium hippocampi]